MLRLSLGAAALLALAALSAPALDDAKSDLPFAGRWKVTLIQGEYAISFCVVDLQGTTAKPTATVVATLPKYSGAKVRDVKADAGSLRFTVTATGGPFQVAAYAPKGEDKPKVLYATLQGPQQLFLGRLEATEQEELKERDDVSIDDGFDQFAKLRGKDYPGKLKILRGIIEDFPGKPAAIAAARQLVTELSTDADATEDGLRSAAKALLDATQPYGRELEVQTAATAARELLQSDKGVNAAIEVARRGEKLLTDADPPVRVAALLQTLSDALHKAGKGDEARAYAPRLAKLNKALDDEYEKTAIPFKPGKFGGRKGKSQRVVVCELFTGAQCPPCVAADVAFDAALKTYGPGDVAFLQYHLHIPGPDPLTNNDTLSRAKYYEKTLGGTPTAYVDGKMTPALGGRKQNGEASYNTLRKVLETELEQDAGAELKLGVTRTGDKIEVKAEVAGLKKPGEQVKLRLVLVEEVARYTGSNGQRLHHHVVRALPGGADGTALKDATATQTVTIDLADVRKAIGDYLTEYNKSRDAFSPTDMAAPLENLLVVALIQDDASQQVVQAAQMKVPEVK